MPQEEMLLKVMDYVDILINNPKPVPLNDNMRASIREIVEMAKERNKNFPDAGDFSEKTIRLLEKSCPFSENQLADMVFYLRGFEKNENQEDLVLKVLKNRAGVARAEDGL